MENVSPNSASGNRFSPPSAPSADPKLSREINLLIGRTFAHLEHATVEQAIAKVLRCTVGAVRSYGAAPGYVKTDRADIAVRLLRNLNCWADKLSLVETADSGAQMAANTRIFELIELLAPAGLSIACALDRSGERFVPYYRLCCANEIEWTNPQDGRKPRRKPFLFGASASPKAKAPAKASSVPVRPDPLATLKGVQTGLFGYQAEPWRDPDFGERGK